MAGLDLVSLLLGGVGGALVGAAAGVLGERFVIQPNQQRQAMALTTWNTRRERADRIELVAGRVLVGSEHLYPPQDMWPIIFELFRSLGEFGDTQSVRSALVLFCFRATWKVRNLGAEQSPEDESKAWEGVKESYAEVMAALQKYRDGEPPMSNGARVRKAFHLPASWQE